MAESLFIRADEVIRLLGVSKSEAYRIIKRLNDEIILFCFLFSDKQEVQTQAYGKL